MATVIYDYGNYRKRCSYNGYNFAQSMLYDKKEYKRDAASIRGYLQITPLEGLSYKMSLNIDYNSRFAHFYDNPTYGKEPLTGGVEKENVRTTGLTYNNVINWNHTFNENHDVRLMAWSGILRIQHVQFWRFPYRCHYRRLLRTRCSFYTEFFLWQQRPIQIVELLRQCGIFVPKQVFRIGIGTYRRLVTFPPRPPLGNILVVWRFVEDFT